ncbi:MAG TPA: Calx-beta domain-containing protein [Mycobacteriales bacterium]|nr:Calx-beta domain-containing protein [Mycobacteriales bacterium]
MTLPATFAVGAVWLPTANATSSLDRSVILGPGQSATISRVVTAPPDSVTPVMTCDPDLSVAFDADLNETVSVAPGASVGTEICTIDFQVSGQSIGFIQQVTVNIPGLSVSDVTVTEPDSGSAPATFTVSMSQASTATVTAHYATADGTTNGAADYGPISGTVTFAPGETSKTLTVAVEGDMIDESDETFAMNLSDGVGAAITRDGTATILDQDRNGLFSCRASVLNVNGTESVIANAAGSPCQDDLVQTGSSSVQNGLFSLTVAGPSAATDQTPDTLSGTVPAAGDSATATATLSTITIVTAHLVTITLDVMTSSVTAQCASTGSGLAPQFSGSSVIVGLNVGGTPMTVGSAPTDIPLIIGTLHLNYTDTTATSVTQKAVWLQTALGNVVVDTATAGVQGSAAHPSGNPCVTR